jgi:hypothetical protein
MHSRFPSKQKFSLLNTFIYERPLWGVRFKIKGFRAKSPMTAFGPGCVKTQSIVKTVKIHLKSMKYKEK